MPATFDSLLAMAEPLIRAGDHQRDRPPVHGSDRWGPSMLMRLPAPLRERVHALAREVEQLTGAGHFRTGHPEASHLSVRGLAPYSDSASATDELSVRFAAALSRAAVDTPPLRFAITGVTLTPISVMVQVEADGDDAWDLLRRVGDELGPDGYYESAWGQRDLFYTNVIHFADQIEDPNGLISWVRRHRALEPIPFEVNEIELVRYWHTQVADAQLMRIDTWSRTPLRAGAAIAR